MVRLNCSKEKGSIIELVLEKKIDVVSVYSVDRISRNLKDLLSVIDFLHENRLLKLTILVLLHL